MNNTATTLSPSNLSAFTEENFKNELKLNEELVKKCQKLMNELDRLKTKAVLSQSLNNLHFSASKSGCGPSIPSKIEPEKTPFYNYGLDYLENPPSVYKLSGDLSTFDEHDIEFNSFLPQRVLSDYLENQKKKYIDELSNKDLIKNNFVDGVTKSLPKPPKKWVKFVDEEGDEYFYNTITGISQWKRPDKYED